MKNILLAIAFFAALPVVVNAQEQMEAAEKPAAKEHHMQNSNPSPKPTEQKPEHVMHNDNPSPKAAEKKPEHVMRNN